MRGMRKALSLFIACVMIFGTLAAGAGAVSIDRSDDSIIITREDRDGVVFVAEYDENGRMTGVGIAGDSPVEVQNSGNVKIFRTTEDKKPDKAPFDPNMTEFFVKEGQNETISGISFEHPVSVTGEGYGGGSLSFEDCAFNGGLTVINEDRGSYNVVFKSCDGAVTVVGGRNVRVTAGDTSVSGVWMNHGSLSFGGQDVPADVIKLYEGDSEVSREEYGISKEEWKDCTDLFFREPLFNNDNYDDFALEIGFGRLTLRYENIYREWMRPVELGEFADSINDVLRDNAVYKDYKPEIGNEHDRAISWVYDHNGGVELPDTQSESIDFGEVKAIVSDTLKALHGGEYTAPEFSFDYEKQESEQVTREELDSIMEWFRRQLPKEAAEVYEYTLERRNDGEYLNDVRDTTLRGLYFAEEVVIRSNKVLDNDDYGGRVRFENCEFAKGIKYYAYDGLSCDIEFTDCEGAELTTVKAQDAFVRFGWNGSFSLDGVSFGSTEEWINANINWRTPWGAESGTEEVLFVEGPGYWRSEDNSQDNREDKLTLSGTFGGDRLETGGVVDVSGLSLAEGSSIWLTGNDSCYFSAGENDIHVDENVRGRCGEMIIWTGGSVISHCSDAVLVVNGVRFEALIDRDDDWVGMEIAEAELDAGNIKVDGVSLGEFDEEKFALNFSGDWTRLDIMSELLNGGDTHLEISVGGGKVVYDPLQRVWDRRLVMSDFADRAINDFFGGYYDDTEREYTPDIQGIRYNTRALNFLIDHGGFLDSRVRGNGFGEWWEFNNMERENIRYGEVKTVLRDIYRAAINDESAELPDSVAIIDYFNKTEWEDNYDVPEWAYYDLTDMLRMALPREDVEGDVSFTLARLSDGREQVNGEDNNTVFGQHFMGSVSVSCLEPENDDPYDNYGGFINFKNCEFDSDVTLSALENVNYNVMFEDCVFAENARAVVGGEKGVVNVYCGCEEPVRVVNGSGIDNADFDGAAFVSGSADVSGFDGWVGQSYDDWQDDRYRESHIIVGNSKLYLNSNVRDRQYYTVSGGEVVITDNNRDVEAVINGVTVEAHANRGGDSAWIDFKLNGLSESAVVAVTAAINGEPVNDLSFRTDENGWTNVQGDFYNIYDTALTIGIDGARITYDPILREWERTVSVQEFARWRVAGRLEENGRFDFDEIGIDAEKLDSVWPSQQGYNWDSDEHWYDDETVKALSYLLSLDEHIFDGYDNPNDPVNYGTVKRAVELICEGVNPTLNYDKDDNDILISEEVDYLTDYINRFGPKQDIDGDVEIAVHRVCYTPDGWDFREYIVATVGGETQIDDSNFISGVRFAGKVTIKPGSLSYEGCEPDDPGNNYYGMVHFENCEFVNGVTATGESGKSYNIGLLDNCTFGEGKTITVSGEDGNVSVLNYNSNGAVKLTTAGFNGVVAVCGRVDLSGAQSARLEQWSDNNFAERRTSNITLGANTLFVNREVEGEQFYAVSGGKIVIEEANQRINLCVNDIWFSAKAKRDNGNYWFDYYLDDPELVRGVRAFYGENEIEIDVDKVDENGWTPVWGNFRDIYGTKVSFIFDGFTLTYDPIPREWEREASLWEYIRWINELAGDIGSNFSVPTDEEGLAAWAEDNAPSIIEEDNYHSFYDFIRHDTAIEIASAFWKHEKGAESELPVGLFNEGLNERTADWTMAIDQIENFIWNELRNALMTTIVHNLEELKAALGGGGDIEIAGDITIDEDLTLSPERSLIVGEDVTLTISEGASFTLADGWFIEGDENAFEVNGRRYVLEFHEYGPDLRRAFSRLENRGKVVVNGALNAGEFAEVDNRGTGTITVNGSMTLADGHSEFRGYFTDHGFDERDWDDALGDMGWYDANSGASFRNCGDVLINGTAVFGEYSYTENFADVFEDGDGWQSFIGFIRVCEDGELTVNGGFEIRSQEAPGDSGVNLKAILQIDGAMTVSGNLNNSGSIEVNGVLEIEGWGWFSNNDEGGAELEIGEDGSFIACLREDEGNNFDFRRFDGIDGVKYSLAVFSPEGFERANGSFRIEVVGAFAPNAGEYTISDSLTVAEGAVLILSSGVSVTAERVINDGRIILTGGTLNYESLNGNPIDEDVDGIDSDLTLSEDMTVARNEIFEIPEGKTLTVPDGKKLTVEGVLIVNGTLAVEEGGEAVFDDRNGGAIIPHSDEAIRINGHITVISGEMIVEGFENVYCMFGAPMTYVFDRLVINPDSVFAIDRGVTVEAAELINNGELELISDDQISVSPIPGSVRYMVPVSTMDELRTALLDEITAEALFETEEPFVIDEDLMVPPDKTLNVRCMVTVSEGVTVDVRGGIVNFGFILNNGTIICDSPIFGPNSFEGNPPARHEYIREDDSDVYAEVLSEYAVLMTEASAEDDLDTRYVKYAKAEAALLDSAVMIPTTTQGGAYAVSRIAPHTTPFTQFGSDDSRLFGLVISDELITKEERADLNALWESALNGGSYDPAAYLTGKGHTILNSYTTTFSVMPYTLDWLNTYSQADLEILVNCADGLVQYDNLGRLQPALAESWEVSDDGLTYTFRIRDDAKWYTSDGNVFAPVTAYDFVDGYNHLSAAIFEGVVESYSATDDQTLVITLERPTPYFITMLTYSAFMPYCKSFADNCESFGSVDDPANQVYCGPFIPKSITSEEIVLEKNPSYYNAGKVALNSIRWVYDNGEDSLRNYEDTVSGVYAATSLSALTGTLDKAKSDGIFEDYAYITETTSTSYFGGLNLNRGAFAIGSAVSDKNEWEKADTHTALMNKNFRKALQHAFDKTAYNAVSRGEDLAEANLRNMYTHPGFVVLSKDVTLDGKTFTAGTSYGEIVRYYVGDEIDVSDGVDGWYDPTAAKDYLETARIELCGSVVFPIRIDVVYFSASDVNTVQAEAYKSSIEETLGAENVVVNLVGADSSDDFYASGYRAENGAAGNYDMFYGSGWGPDYGDPSTYLDTFLAGGYMTRVIGLF